MARALLIASLIAFLALVASPDAQAKPKKKSCARAIINDWYGDGQIDKQYEPHCYKEAIRALPVDIKDYSHAPEDILRALAYRKLGKPDPGNGSTPGTDPSDGSSGPGDPHQQTGPDETSPSDSNGVDTVANPDLGLDTSSPSSIPIPLLVLGGLALLLLAAGGAGYVNRRLQARGTDDPGP
jgi:hypothetical protein